MLLLSPHFTPKETGCGVHLTTTPTSSLASFLLCRRSPLCIYLPATSPQEMAHAGRAAQCCSSALQRCRTESLPRGSMKVSLLLRRNKEEAASRATRHSLMVLSTAVLPQREEIICDQHGLADRDGHVDRCKVLKT